METSFYRPGNSLLHRLDPRSKLLLLLAVLLLAVATMHPAVPAALAVGAVAAAWVARVGGAVRRVGTLIGALFFFSVLVWSLIPLLRAATGSPISGAALLTGVVTGLKLASMTLWSVLYLATTRTEAMTVGLLKLGLPYPAAFAFTTAVRLVPSLVGAAVTTIEAQKSRGLDAESGSVLTRVRKHVPLLVPIIASTLRSTHTFAMALEARGFRARPGRTSLLALRLRPADWLTIGLAAALLALAVLLWGTGL